MKIFFTCLAALWFGSYVMWSSGEIAERNNRIKDLQEETDFLCDGLEKSERTYLLVAARQARESEDLESDVRIAERQVCSLRKKVEIMETTGLKCVQSLGIVQRKVTELYDEVGPERLEPILASLSETYRNMFTVFVGPLRVRPPLAPSLSPARSSNGSDAGLSRQ